MQIRTEKEEDFGAIDQLVASAFRQDFESKLVEKLRNGPNYIPVLALVAEENNQLLGYILFSKIKIVGKSTTYDTLALAPLAVDPPHQNKGIGSLLVNYGLVQAKKLGYASVIVLGHAEYYRRFGFKQASHWNIRCPFEVPDEAFMAFELTDGALEGKAGVVVYPTAFTEM